MNGVLRSGDIRAKIEEWLKYSRLLSVCNVGECVLLGEGAGGSPAPVRLVLVPSGLAELGRTSFAAPRRGSEGANNQIQQNRNIRHD